MIVIDPTHWTAILPRQMDGYQLENPPSGDRFFDANRFDGGQFGHRLYNFGPIARVECRSGRKRCDHATKPFRFLGISATRCPQRASNSQEPICRRRAKVGHYCSTFCNCLVERRIVKSSYNICRVRNNGLGRTIESSLNLERAMNTLIGKSNGASKSNTI